MWHTEVSFARHSFFSRKKGGKTTRPEVTFLPEAHRRVSGCGKTCSLGSDPVFATTKPDFGFWAGECQELGQNFLSQAELCDSVCSGTLPVYLYELAAIFHCAGPSPGESLSERNLSKLWWKLLCYLPLNRFGYTCHTKNAAKNKTANRNPSTNNQILPWFSFLHFTPLWVVTYTSKAAEKPFTRQQGWGHVINYFSSRWGSQFGWKISFQHYLPCYTWPP